MTWPTKLATTKTAVVRRVATAKAARRGFPARHVTGRAREGGSTNVRLVRPRLRRVRIRL